jgi:hypothetical protein
MNQELKYILETRRPSGSQSETKFAAWVVRQFPQHLVEITEAGNLLFRIGESRTLFASHIDTVCSDNSDTPNELVFKGSTVKAFEHQLGADDGVGVWLLLSMMAAGKQGNYVFTRGEECGAAGAREFAMHPLLLEIDRSICFDRRGVDEVVTHQSCERGASDIFGDAVCDALNNQGLLYMPSDAGVFTDNALWFDAIPENLNIAAGYALEHSRDETLNLEHAEALCKAVINIDWDSLPTARQPRAYGDEDGYLKEAVIDALHGDTYQIAEHYGGGMALISNLETVTTREWERLAGMEEWEIDIYLQDLTQGAY